MTCDSVASLGWFVCYKVAFHGGLLVEQPSTFFKATSNLALFWEFLSLM